MWSSLCFMFLCFLFVCLCSPVSVSEGSAYAGGVCVYLCFCFCFCSPVCVSEGSVYAGGALERTPWPPSREQNSFTAT